LIRIPDSSRTSREVQKCPLAEVSGYFTSAGCGVIFNRQLPMGRAEIL
jgi:hypothetical protein